MKPQLILIVAFLALGAHASQAIDELVVFQPVVRAETGSATPVNVTATTNPGDISTSATHLGSRELIAVLVNGVQSTEVATRAVSGSLQCNTASLTEGFCMWHYFNIGGVNLMDCGCGCFSILELNPDRIHAIEMEVRSGSDVATSSITLPAFPGERIVCLDFGTPLAAYQAVDEIFLRVDATLEDQLDVVIEQFCCVPPTIGWHTISSPGPFLTGECAIFNLFIDNPARVPPSAESFSFVFPLNGLGTVTVGSLSCSNGIASSIVGGEATGSGTLAIGASTACSFEVCFNSPGTADFWAVVTNTAIGNTYNTNADSSRFPSNSTTRQDICQPPTPTSITVQLPPTTEPPTTEPPTTEPPTTEPPTTEPPTTSPPTTLPPTTLPPTTLPPTTLPPTTGAPTTLPPTTLPPTTRPPTTLPPTTLPPTTEPPTTEPPTTEPPTTEPPTTEPPTPSGEVCIWANIQDNTCMCKAFPCQCTGTGVQKTCHCPADEWYCFFVDPAQQEDEFFDVGYCGSDGIKQKCVCDLAGNVISGPEIVH